jgi:hypothetical protein
MEVQRQARLGLELPKGWEYDLVTGKPVRQLVQDTVQEEKKMTDTTMSDFGRETVEGFQIGQRCEVQPGGRRGRVVFIGEVIELASGFWVWYLMNPWGRQMALSRAANDTLNANRGMEDSFEGKMLT